MRLLFLAATSGLLAACSAQLTLERVSPQKLGTIEVPNEDTEGGYQYVYCIVGEGAYSCDRMRGRYGLARPDKEGSMSVRKEDEGEDGEKVSQVKLSNSLVQALKEELQVKNKVIRVQFPFDVFHLHQSEKEKIAAEALRLRGEQISIVGFTDDVGTQEYNDALALRRAESVADFIRRKIPGVTIINIEGKGRCCYLEKNIGEIKRQGNRRAEVIITLNKSRLNTAKTETK
ncbi:OmpA family protein [uncultured Microbulbifer sp.]|uniref:OmpA family protein n=1 Tax=uncultured Microbulbifer sp. TaxID=348147 RepID=UPI0026017F8F|nr:OmpA family protein [uncultured Microbulbifer sp.]